MALQPINEYSRLMVEKMDERKSVPVPTAFQGAFYGRPEFSNDSKTIEIDIIRARGRTLAQMVNRGTHSDDTGRIANQKEGKFTNIQRAWPLVESTGSIENGDITTSSC